MVRVLAEDGKREVENPLEIMQLIVTLLEETDADARHIVPLMGYLSDMVVAMEKKNNLLGITSHKDLYDTLLRANMDVMNELGEYIVYD